MYIVFRMTPLAYQVPIVALIGKMIHSPGDESRIFMMVWPIGKKAETHFLVTQSHLAAKIKWYTKNETAAEELWLFNSAPIELTAAENS